MEFFKQYMSSAPRYTEVEWGENCVTKHEMKFASWCR